MVAFSIELPDELAAVSLEVARGLGLSRSELIRRALEHEIAQARAALERRAMAESLRTMAADPDGRRRAEDLDAALDAPLPPERDSWWTG